MRHALDPAPRRSIKVSVEHAPGRTELELEPSAFAHLERGIAKVGDELSYAEAEDPAPDLRQGRGGRLGYGLLGRCRAAGDEQG